mmetsp:Transcript_48079/g.127294  ORF Transcript_48079/g.127294 Transcript_48079/m.127294 type:complete len:300 (-) Transcript_48079:221-1120(-)
MADNNVQPSQVVAWMWGDSQGPFGKSIASVNPVRWSSKKTFKDTVRELVSVKELNPTRPVDLKIVDVVPGIFGSRRAPTNESKYKDFPNIDEAIAHLVEMASDAGQPFDLDSLSVKTEDNRAEATVPPAVSLAVPLAHVPAVEAETAPAAEAELVADVQSSVDVPAEGAVEQEACPPLEVISEPVTEETASPPSVLVETLVTPLSSLVPQEASPSDPHPDSAAQGDVPSDPAVEANDNLEETGATTPPLTVQKTKTAELSKEQSVKIQEAPKGSSMLPVILAVLVVVVAGGVAFALNQS